MPDSEHDHDCPCFDCCMKRADEAEERFRRWDRLAKKLDSEQTKNAAACRLDEGPTAFWGKYSV